MIGRMVLDICEKVFSSKSGRKVRQASTTFDEVSNVLTHIQHYKSTITHHLLTGKFSTDVLWNLGSLALLGVSGVLINTIIAHYQSPSSLGVFNQAFAFYIVLSQLAVGGMQFSIVKYLSHTDDRDLMATVISSALVAITGTAVLVAAVAFLLTHYSGVLFKSKDVTLGIQFICPALVLFSVNKGFMMVLNGTRRMRAYAIFQGLRYVLIIVGIIGLIAAGFAGPYLAWCFLVSEFLLAIGLIGFVHKSIVGFGLRHVTRAWIYRHLSFGVRGFFGGMLSDLNTRVDIILLGYFVSDASVGIYSFAAVFAEGFGQISYVVKQNLDPIIGRFTAAQNIDRLRSLMHKVVLVFVPAMLALSIVSVLLFPVMVRLFTDDRFLESWPMFTILLTGIAINAGFRPFQGVFLLTGRPGLHSLFFLVVVLSNAILNVLLIQRMGTVGAAVATSMAYVIESLLILWGMRTILVVKGVSVCAR
jgi:O-antigen/teichoic acid export membrane protein